MKNLKDEAETREDIENEFKKKRGNEYAKAIRLRCADIGMPLKTLGELTQLTSTLFDHHGNFHNTPEKQELFTVDHVAKYHLVCGIHPKELFVPKSKVSSLFRPRKKALYFDEDHWKVLEKYFRKSNSLIDYIRYAGHDTGYNIELENAYRRIAKSYIIDVDCPKNEKPDFKAKSTIEVFEVLFKYGQAKAYVNSQKIIHIAIQEWLNNNKKYNSDKSYHYTRTLSVSESTILLAKDKMAKVIRAMIAETTKETLVHLLWAMKKHPDHCTFKVSKASWYKNQMLIDKQIAVTEDYTIVNRGFVFPEGMFIHDVTEYSKAHELIDVMEMQSNEEHDQRRGDILILKIDDIIGTVNAKGEIKGGIIGLATHVARQIAKREKALEKIKDTKALSADIEQPYFKELFTREKKIIDKLKLLKRDILNKAIHLDNSDLNLNLKLKEKVNFAMEKIVQEIQKNK